MFRNSRLLVLALLTVAACTSPPPKPQTALLNLSRSNFADLPDWSAANADAALAAFRRSCAVLAAKPDATPMSGAGYAGTVVDWRAPCAETSGDAKAFFEKNGWVLPPNHKWDITDFGLGDFDKFGLVLIPFLLFALSDEYCFCTRSGRSLCPFQNVQKLLDLIRSNMK